MSWNKNLILTFLVLFSSLLSVSSANGANCERFAIGENIREFMNRNALISSEDEIDFPAIGIQIKWRLLKTVSHHGDCLFVMALSSAQDLNEALYLGAYEVIGFDVSQKRFLKFEELVSLPKSTIAKIGDPPKDDRKLSYYYVLLSGESLAQAYKAVLGEIDCHGFRGIAVKSGKKAEYDPTLHPRNWHVEQATFSLRRGMSNETDDIQSFQLDGLDSSKEDDYWSGCNKAPHPKYPACVVAPWGQAFIHSLLPEHKE